MAEDRNTNTEEIKNQSESVKEDDEKSINDTASKDNTASAGDAEKAKDDGVENDADEGKIGRADKKKIKKLETEIADKDKKLEFKEKEIKSLNDKYLRMMAEYDNFRKRSAKEKESTYADAYADAIATVLPVFDNLEKASEYSDAEAVKKGVQMTLKGVQDSFEKLGIEAFGKAGEKFDPNRHNAVMHIDDESLEEGVIVEVFQKGFAKGDKVIRYAMVKVAN